MRVGISTAHRTAFGRVSRCGNGVAILREVSNIGTICRRREGVLGIGGNYYTALDPFGESIACSRSGRQRDFGTVGVGTAAVHRTLRLVFANSRDGVGVELEGGGYQHIGGGHDEAVVRHRHVA